MRKLKARVYLIYQGQQPFEKSTCLPLSLVFKNLQIVGERGMQIAIYQTLGQVW